MERTVDHGADRLHQRTGRVSGSGGGPGPIGPLGQLVVVRHGETAWSRDRRHTGRTDVPLLPEGEAQALDLGRYLQAWQFGAVLVSPLVRARRTCELAGFGEEAVVEPDLAEWDYGAYEGRTSAEISAERPGWSLWSDGVERGETLAGLGDRADRVVARVRQVEGDVLVFGHGHALRVLAARWVGLDPGAGALFSLSPCGIGVLGWEHAAPVLCRWNAGPELFTT